MSQKAKFNAAVAFIKDKSNPAFKTPLSNEQKLKLYGLFKQATTGDNDKSQPRKVQFEARAKWEAHESHKGKTKEAAMGEYAAFFEELKIGQNTVWLNQPASAPSEIQSASTEDKMQSQNCCQTTFVARTFCTKWVSCRDFITWITEVCTKLISWVLFDRTFVAAFCVKLVSYHCGITSLLVTVVMFFTFCEMYKTASIWAHGKDYKDGVACRFERGDANTQLEFVGRKWRVFSIIFAAAALCTMGQICTTRPSTVQPETISHVFCKTYNETKLECLVNATYYNPSEPETEKCFCDTTSTEWDFCGALLLFTYHLCTSKCYSKVVTKLIVKLAR